MIRLKCPKCAATLKLDDEEAGQVSVCTECGARFKVPAKKAGAKTPAAKADKKPAPDAEDEQDDSPDDEGGESKKLKSKAKAKEESGSSKGVMAGVFLALIVFLGLGSYYVKGIGVMVAVISGVMLVISAMMAARSSGADEAGKQRLYFASAGFFFLCVACGAGVWLQGGRIEEKRKETLKRIDGAIPVVRPLVEV